MAAFEIPPVQHSDRGDGTAFVDLPYPLPPEWQMHAAKRAPVWMAALGVTGTFVFATAAYSAAARGDLRDLMVWALFFAGIGLATSVAFQRTGGERRLPAMINAIALSRAIERPVDSWIHFFRQTGPSRWQTTFFSIAGFGASGLFVWASVLSFMTAPWALLATVPLLLGSLFVAFAGVMAVLLRWRHSSFARRPIGLSLGRHGFVYYYVNGIDEWPWESIGEVRASVGAVDESTGDFSPSLIIEPAVGAQNDLKDYGLGDYQSHPMLIYTAVRFWFEHPDARRELSTTYAQRRIEGWAKSMSAP
ncbi:MAG: hypothetical protein ACOH1T_07970 [Microbacteriaceae bacterium]